MKHNESFGQHTEATRVPESFPIVAIEEKLMWFDIDDDSQLIEDTVVFYTRYLPHSEPLKGYRLLHTIGDHQYVLRCSQNSGGYYSFDFKTRDHDYARTQLSDAAADELGQTIHAFLHTLSSSEHDPVERVMVSPADTAYTVDTVEACKDAIEEIQSSEHDRQSLDLLKSYEVFDLYRGLTGADYEGVDRNKMLNHERSRLFKRYIKKYLPEWQIDDTFSSYSADFQLVLKK